MNRDAAAGTVITAGFDYLTPEVNRPDLFEERYTMRSSAGRRSNPNSSNQIIITLMTVILSAFIFLTIVAYGSIAQVYFDSIVVSEVITPLVESRFYYAVTVTFATLVIGVLFWYIYVNIRPEPHSRHQSEYVHPSASRPYHQH